MGAERLVVDLRARRVWQGVNEIDLTQREFAVLSYLVQHAGCVVSSAEFLEAVWGRDAVVSDAALRAVIKQLRRKLGDDAHKPRYIVTVWGRGYRFDP